MVRMDPQMGEDSSSVDHHVASLNSDSVVSDSGTVGDPLLELKEVTKIFDNGVLALDKVSFQMKKGEFLFLVGSNRSGKTTLLKLIACEDRPSEGEIHFDGFDSRKMKRKQISLLRQKMARIFQDFRLINDMNVFDNVALSLRILGKKEKKIKDKVFGALGWVGLPGKSKFLPPQLSSAEKQKAAIARAIAGDPLLLLADEPTSNLDDESANEILELLKRASLFGTAVLVATNDLRLCDGRLARRIRIKEGKVV
jgi:cell division transport system ATP-binding protein